MPVFPVDAARSAADQAVQELTVGMSKVDYCTIYVHKANYIDQGIMDYCTNLLGIPIVSAPWYILPVFILLFGLLLLALLYFVRRQ